MDQALLLTTSLRRPVSKYQILLEKLERAKGFEPSTPTLARLAVPRCYGTTSTVGQSVGLTARNYFFATILGT